MAGAGQCVTFGNLRLAQRHGATHRIVAGNDFGFYSGRKHLPDGQRQPVLYYSRASSSVVPIRSIEFTALAVVW